MSLSLRRAWIEIFTPSRNGLRFASLSLRRAWIEISMTSPVNQIWTSRSPYGERGLKSVEFWYHWGVCGRSPYGERGLK